MIWLQGLISKLVIDLGQALGTWIADLISLEIAKSRLKKETKAKIEEIKNETKDRKERAARIRDLLSRDGL